MDAPQRSHLVFPCYFIIASFTLIKPYSRRCVPNADGVGAGVASLGNTMGRNKRSKSASRRQYEVERLERRLLLAAASIVFGTQQTYGAGIDPASLAVADLNSDGKPDLLVGNFWGGTVSILLGNGNGTFQAQQTLAAVKPYSVVVAMSTGTGGLICCSLTLAAIV